MSCLYYTGINTLFTSYIPDKCSFSKTVAGVGTPDPPIWGWHPKPPLRLCPRPPFYIFSDPHL